MAFRSLKIRKIYASHSHHTRQDQETAPVNSRNKVVVASLIGTAIEFFDFYIYATAAVIVFPHIFFPQGDPAAATLQSLATFAIAFIARPIGSAYSATSAIASAVRSRWSLRC
jgi:MFS family permease